jgi:AraC family transcriptional regulator
MNTQILKVLYYIEAHLNDSLDVKTLAKVAGYSPYHFSRIFKMYMGESIISYVSRLRLEKALLKIISNNKSIIEIAFEAGFETPNGFNKAFKKIFDITPTEYKNIRISLLHSYKNKMMQTPKIVERETTYVIYVREIGGYAKSSEIAWEKLIKKLNEWNKNFKEKSIKLKLEQKKVEMIGICHDDPSVTAEENIRYDASLAWGKKERDFLSKQGFDTKEIPDGKYAMVLYKGAYVNIVDSWMALYSWCEENGYTFRDYPPFEKYLNSPEDVSEEELLTEIYIPIDTY